MTEPVYTLKDLPGGGCDEVNVNLLPNRSVVLVVAGGARRFARIVVWQDDLGLRAAYVDIDARPLRRVLPSPHKERA